MVGRSPLADAIRLTPRARTPARLGREALKASTERLDGSRPPTAERRRQILDVAAEAFAESGYRGISLADVAARVGVSQPGLLLHYRTKKLLILAVLAERDRQYV